MTKDIQVMPDITPMSIIQSAVASGSDISQLEKLMELQERWETKEAKKAFDKALALFKSEPIKINKDNHVSFKSKDGGFVNYKHATLGNILDQVSPVLAKYGLSLSWRTGQDGTFIKVTAVLAHELGHSESTYLSATADSTGKKNALQAVGSTISYLQRYTALAITGLTTEEMDDDGKKGSDAGSKSPDNYKEPVRENENQRESPTDTKLLDQALAYADSFCDKSLDEFLLMKENELPAGLKALPNDQQRKKLKSVVNSVEELLMEKQGGLKK